jgi:membrane-bound lytic murein transglycosylase B
MIMRTSFIAALLAATATMACAQAQPPVPAYVPPAFVTSGDPAFDAWRSQFVADAVNRHGLPAAIVEANLAGLTPDPTVVRLNSRQPEFVRPVWDYIASAVSDARITQGRGLVATQRATIGPISARTGVPVEVAVAIWGMESNFGAGKGSMDVFRSLATLAYAGRRTELGNRELLNALRIIQRGEATRATLIGSWAGAMGHTQFMPSSFLELAIDGDNDGRRDIWNDSFDALASTINYLSQRGWKAGEPWGMQVRLPAGFDWNVLDGTKRDAAFWLAAGVHPTDAARSLPEGMQARLLAPAGVTGPVFLVGSGYEAILNYNNSDSYALAVAFLSDRFAGRTPLSGGWPTSNPPVGGADAREMQTLLNALGYDVGPVDGVIGRGTRTQLQAFQRSRGIIADGYASQGALQALRDAMRQATPAAARTPQTAPNSPVGATPVSPNPSAPMPSASGPQTMRVPPPPPGTVPVPDGAAPSGLRPRQRPQPVRMFGPGTARP